MSLLRSAARADWVRAVRSQLSPRRVLPELRLRPGRRVPGQMAAQEARFLKRGGALVVGLGLAGGFGGEARAAESPFASGGPTDPAQADSFLAIHSTNTASVMTGRVELGQGSMAGLLLLVAEELDMEIEQLEFVRHDTNRSPDTGGTFRSSSIAYAGQRLRSAAAAARQALLGLASARLGAPVAALTVSGGVVSAAGGPSITYGDLVGGRLLGVPLPALLLGPGQAPAKPAAEYRLVGISRVPRLDIPATVSGTCVYVHAVSGPRDVARPGRAAARTGRLRTGGIITPLRSSQI